MSGQVPIVAAMKLLKPATPERIAEELFEMYGNPLPYEKQGLLMRWRRARLDRRLGAADFGAVLRAYRAVENRSRADVRLLTRPPRQRLAA